MKKKKREAAFCVRHLGYIYIYSMLEENQQIISVMGVVYFYIYYKKKKCNRMMSNAEQIHFFFVVSQLKRKE